ncbi:energy-coupling factor ABC transporter ATP-binding protein [Haloferax mediterranei ATCC 33500]|uniref:ABC-type cobalt transport system, ATP-binding protein n=1 Tax=Haloferax mediterranei (strain ATCC 33500 / DSM 1411 / JCM 8866 / NBRC 14739 / NCIMB 2177 / R-4) TaxID=523841 RepID=I3R233_HALMT|nr:ABC transporter ATP-binding protein [Haloferax mediterranei]AFK18293.1 ABC-type cobalt transport system, ATP-binding protein [Haloferax mediterranei ATCC 33500]AHZ22307.1 cobalt ABC transporter ATP-binding protein [Haloferax mediterranei ATCC 33500]EMA02434.1 ABC-type cobalt transport system, ATP-binding protein [Haloferax mediterranei ATCC 33500]MDX5988383.1 ATP-binding cassette domain-containing protein [Haloferax mediterranei ATCC 33500]QCQ74812.1 energy-coupling factor ABC transporter A
MTDTPLIRVEDYSFRYPGSDEFVLDGANLSVASGEFLAVLGGNGSGKTTLCKTFNGVIPHFFEGERDGRVVVDGIDTESADVGTLSERVGYVYQDFENQLVQPTVRRDVEFGLLNYGFPDYHERAQHALDLLDIPHLAEQFIWELSGGQKHLAAIAGVLALDPEVLVVDEPAAQLDPQHAADVYDRLKRLNEDGRTVVVIEHDTEFVAEHADRVALVDDGRLRWSKPTLEALNCLDDLRERDIHPPQVTELASRLDVRTSATDRREYPITVDEFVNALGSRQPIAPDGGAAGECPSRSGSPILELDDVTYRYQTMNPGSATPVLDELCLSVHRGENVALVGANGSGKSTLMKLITGLIRPDDGRVDVLGKDTRETSPETLADDVVYIHQQPEEMFIEDSIEADISYYLRQRDHQDLDIVEEVLDYLDLRHLRDQDGRLLSVGQQRRASLAIGLAMQPTLVMLDEPTGCLDMESRREVTRMLGRVDDRVESVVVATHDLQFVASWADRVIVLDRGSVVADAPPDTVLTDSSLERSTSLRPPQPVEVSRRVGIDPPATTITELATRLGGDS